jgi:hypothetical protein
MKRIIPFCTATIFFLIPSLFGQNLTNQNPATSNGQHKDFRPATPTAAGLGLFGQVPVGNFTGTVNFAVPLYEVTYKNFKLPIALNYHGSGNKPDIFPGEMGLGWVLNAGGIITRVVKGLPDFEHYPTPQTGFVPIVDNATHRSDWSSTTYMNQLLNNGYYSHDDLGCPDEFYFELGGVAGRFIIRHDSVYQLKSSNNQYYSIKGEVATNKQFVVPELDQRPDWYPPVGFQYNNSLVKNKLLYRVTITDGAGIKYIFGGTNNSIEFSRPGFGWTSASLDPTDMESMVSPMSWYLSAIEFPNGQKIVLEYKQHTFVTKVGANNVEHSVWNRTNNPPYIGGGLTNSAMAEKSTLFNACYLKSITTPKEVISFTHSEASRQLRFPKDSTLNWVFINNDNRFDHYIDVGNAWTEELVPLKLDSIKVRDLNGKIFRQAAFEYTESYSTRLKLLTVNIFGGNFITPQQYTFEYNPLPLPPYLSYKTDHFGYYNGRNPYINTTNFTYYINLDSALFTQSKEPDTAYLQAEMLRKITYPTRGYTILEYEPHVYSSYVTTWPFGVQANPSNTNKITGGLRIKKVTGYDGTGQVSTQKQYFYRKDYRNNGTISSGVLAYSPIYVENYSGPVVPPGRKSGSPYYNGSMTYHRWSSNPIFPMGFTRGGHVTYSEVAEMDANGGFTVHKYKNYDNGFNDQQPLNYVSDNTAIKQFWKEDEGTSMDLERGQLLSEEMYDSAKAIKARKILKYNDDPNRFSRHVRILMQTANSLNVSDIASFRIVATLAYTYFPFLKEEVSTLYGTANDSIVSTLKYTYDTSYRVTKTTEIINSNGRSQKTIYRYPQDMLSSPLAATYDKMVDSGMVDFIVERERQENQVSLETDIVQYSTALNPRIVLPSQLQTKYLANTAEVRTVFNQYDSTDNILMSTAHAGTTGAAGLKTCYVWSYNRIHPVAIIENADYSTVETALGGKPALADFSLHQPTDQEVRNFLAPLRNSPSLASARVNTYTYDVLVGVTSMTDVNNRTSYYEYDNFGRLAIIRNHDSLIVKTICYNYAGNIEDCSKGRADYLKVTVYWTTNLNDMCNSGGLVQSSDAYQPRSEYINSGGLPVLIARKELFTDKNFSNPLPTGYYKIDAAGTGFTPGGTYWYMVNGRYVYRNVCGFAQPTMLKYSDTTFFNMCAADLPVVPVFGTISQGTTLYADLPPSSKIKDGYYIFNDTYFKAMNGVAGQLRPCSELVPVITTVMAKSPFSGTAVCTGLKANTVYHNQALQVGTYLYQNAALTTIWGQGYYSEGLYVYQVNSSGMITSRTQCN